MSPLSPIAASPLHFATRTESLTPTKSIGIADGVRQAAPAGEGFSDLLKGITSTVSAKETQANDLTRRVLLGESDQLHQSVIAMQEASVAFSLMVEVRNKLVDSYQELMRLQV
jgi:flagellar hook-basal body complex protein FliE